MRSTLTPSLAVTMLILGACSSEKTAPSASAESTALASAPSPAVSASAATAARKPIGPKLVVAATFPARTSVFRLQRALLACTDACMTSTKDLPAKVETFVVDRSGSKKATLFPEAEWRAMYQNNPTIFGERRHVSFSGSYPEDLWASLDAPYDRGGYGSVAPLRAGNSGWAQASEWSSGKRVGCNLDASVWGLVRADERCDDVGLSAPARKLLPVLARSTEKPERLVVFPDGGGALILSGGYARLEGDEWKKKPAPWKELPNAAVALEDGRFVVSSKEGAYVVSKSDDVAPVVLVEATGPEAKVIEGATGFALEPVGSEVWVRFEHDGSVMLAAPDAAAPWKRNLPPRPKPAEEKAPHDLPSPVKLTDACTTPFVMLASNNQPSYKFSASTEAFYGHAELQDALTFVQFTRDAATYFGVQAKTVEQAKQAAEIAKGVKLSPQLTCFDAVGNIPDLVDPPAGVRVYFVNLAHSMTLWP